MKKNPYNKNQKSLKLKKQKEKNFIKFQSKLKKKTNQVFLIKRM